tara:strand:+ start:12364 stop:13158 length:795 start_codon:yes stop_codon:yes gene_type:complete
MFSGIYGIVLRYLYLYTRNPLRAFELFFWPVIHIMLWGYVMQYLQSVGAGSSAVPIAFLLGGVLLWDVQFRASQGVSISFLEDVWTRNLLNIFVAPVRTSEMVAGMCIVGLLRVAVTMPLLLCMAYFAFQFNLFSMSYWLIPFYGSLLLFGWALGILGNSLILRWGQAAEGLVWALPFVVQPISAIFYPVSILPAWLQPLSHAIPVSHIFEGMRDVLAGNSDIAHRLVWAYLLNLIWLLAAGAIMASVLKTARERGLLVKVATQ